MVQELNWGTFCQEHVGVLSHCCPATLLDLCPLHQPICGWKRSVLARHSSGVYSVDWAVEKRCVRA